MPNMNRFTEDGKSDSSEKVDTLEYLVTNAFQKQGSSLLRDLAKEILY